MRIVWDEPKRRANIERHGLDCSRIDEEFDWDTALVIPTKPSRIGRKRMIFVGHVLETGVVVIVASPLVSEALSIVSLRLASEAERALYADS
jgi:uncharacterized DUF497 family protein